MTQALVDLEGPRPPLRLALLGSPNSGKTTLFNGLTGSRAKVGNYPGVTVERRESKLLLGRRRARLLDLPGTYSLSAASPDEEIATRVVTGNLPGEEPPDALVAVVDGTTLRRGLGLVAQVLALGRPTLLVVTMIDEIRARGGKLDLAALSRRLGIPVAGVVGHRGVGLDRLRRLLEDPERWPQPAEPPPADDPAERFAWVDALFRQVVGAETPEDSRTQRIDRVLLHPVAGSLVFAAVMVFLFQSIFTWAVPAMDALDQGFSELGRLSRLVLPAGLLTDLWADGILAGVGSVLVFLPQIVLLFTLIHFLEGVGYLGRAAFLVDRILGWVGLQGRCFVSLLSAYACAIPAIMSTRAIRSPRERLATILVSPFMTCSARLPVYTLLIAAFVPATTVWGPLGLQGLVMLGLYLLGALTALGSAALLSSTLLRGSPSSFMMELPPYRFPSVRVLAMLVWRSAAAFLKRAGTIILLASMVIWGLLSFPRATPDPALDPAGQARVQLEGSVAGHLGRALEPAIAPLGYDWKIGVGLIASLAAREIFVSTLAQIYAVSDPEDYDGLRNALHRERDAATGRPVYSLATALSLLVFFVFALQCTSTIAIMGRETGSWRWPALAFAYMLALAWGASFVTYRVAQAFGL
ncbi:MAG: ferrous iron transporter B [Myxococcales bacterium]|nr:ferrous iron transporter B [Myxococcales bacterium]